MVNASSMSLKASVNVGYLQHRHTITHPFLFPAPSPLPLTHNVIESVDWLVLHHSLCLRRVILVDSLLHSLHELLKISEPLKERLVGQKLDVLVVIEGLVGGAALVHLLEVVRLMRVDPFQDTQSPGVGEGRRETDSENTH